MSSRVLTYKSWRAAVEQVRPSIDNAGVTYEFAEIDCESGRMRVDERGRPVHVIERFCHRPVELGQRIESDGKVFARIISRPAAVRSDERRGNQQIVHGLPKWCPGLRHVPAGRRYAGSAVVTSSRELREACHVANNAMGADESAGTNCFTPDLDIPLEDDKD